MLKLGDYKTYGEWDARVVWVSEINDLCYVVHQPGTKNESSPIAHNKFNGMALPVFVLNGPPQYGKHLPADIIIGLE